MSRPRIVIVGAGFAGYRAARTLARLTRHRAEITLLHRVRVAADRVLDAARPRQGVQLGLGRSWSVPLDTASPEPARVAGPSGDPRQRQSTRSSPAAASRKSGAGSEGDS